MFAKQTVSYALHGNQRISCKVSKECFFFISDFYCDKEKLVIEVDGEIHSFPPQFQVGELSVGMVTSKGMSRVDTLPVSGRPYVCKKMA